MPYVTGATIRALREKRGYTQKQLAELLAVSDKAVSKWETQKGLPDISLLEPLARALGVSVMDLLSGDCVTNRNRAGNLMRTAFYVCPVCGNVLTAVGESAVSCCGISLPVQEPEQPDEAHTIRVERVDGEYLVTLEHPMEKSHYLTFAAYVTCDRVQFCKLYPEQMAQVRFPMQGSGVLYVCCNRHGLFHTELRPVYRRQSAERQTSDE